MKKKMKERITETAVILFNKNGSHRITTNHIIDELKISPGTFYYHYRNKEEIIRDIFTLITEEFASVMAGFASAGDFRDISENLKKMFSLYFEYSFFYTEISMLIDRDSELKKIYFENYKLKNNQIFLLFKSMEEKGFLKKGFTESDDFRYVSDILWILSDFRTSFLKTTGRKITKKEASEGFINYLMILKPYMSENTEKEFKIFLSKVR